MRRLTGSVFAIVLLLLSGGSSAVIAQSCDPSPMPMVAWWPLDETTGTTSGDLIWGQTGNHIGSPTAVTGKVAGALLFNGTTDYVEVPTSQSLNVVGDNFSIDAWIRPDVPSEAVVVIIDKRIEESSSTVKGYSLYLYKGQLGLQIADGAVGGHVCGAGRLFPCENFSSSHSRIDDGAWHHVAVSVDYVNDASTFYVDGSVAGQFSLGRYWSLSLGNSMPFRIGRRSDSSDPGFFTGAIDEVEFFDRALISYEVSDIYVADIAGKCKDIGKVSCEVFPFQGGDEPAGAIATVSNHTSVTLASVDWEIETTGYLTGGPHTGSLPSVPVNERVSYTARFECPNPEFGSRENATFRTTNLGAQNCSETFTYTCSVHAPTLSVWGMLLLALLLLCSGAVLLMRRRANST